MLMASRSASINLTELNSQLRVFLIMHDTIEIETGSNQIKNKFYEFGLVQIK